VTEEQNELGIGKPFPGITEEALKDPDLYAAQKELYLGSLCEVEDTPRPWQFWMIMLKNGNFDTTAGLCPKNGKTVGPFKAPGRFPCFGPGCMNQPTFYHDPTSLSHDNCTLSGGLRGSYDLDADISKGTDGISYYEVTWEKQVGEGSWAFKHKLKTSSKYPWLMLYLRADATKGFSGGYHYDTRGMLKIVCVIPIFCFIFALLLPCIDEHAHALVLALIWEQCKNSSWKCPCPSHAFHVPCVACLLALNFVAF